MRNETDAWCLSHEDPGVLLSVSFSSSPPAMKVSFCDVLRVISKIVTFWSSLGNKQLEKMPEAHGHRVLKAFCCASH